MAFKFELTEEKNMIVEDPIYGEFIVPYPYSEMILTKEMKRLEDITQNGFSQYDYPDLINNERLSHSVGAFYMMSNILNHLEEQLKPYNIEISQEEKDIALSAMLLHDIGHGPFSHALERTMKYLNFPEYSHEKRTADILLQDTQIHSVLEKSFGKKNIKKIASFISEIEDDTEIDGETNSFTNLLKSLVSHQLDADRLDYLIRDAYHAGVVSAIDYKKIISSLGVVVNNKSEYELTINKNQLSSIEMALIQRFQMYRDVYFTKSAQIMNIVFPEILKRYNENKESVTKELPSAFLKLISDPTAADLEEFLSMTDTPFMESFKIIKDNCSDEILTYLCNPENMKQYETIEANVSVEEIKKGLSEIFAGRDFSQSICVFEDISKIKLYKKSEGLKITDEKKISDLSEETNLIKPQDALEKKSIFFNPELLRLELQMEKEEFASYMSDLDKMLEDITKKPEEFELKYIIPEEAKKSITMEAIIAELTKSGFSIVEETQKENDDKYYDDKQATLLQTGGSLRVREVTKAGKTKYKGTYKLPTGEVEIYSSRKEVEVPLENNSLGNLTTEMKKKGIPFDIDTVLSAPVLNSVTHRRDIVLERNGIKICLSWDNTKYTNHVLENTQAEDMMIEIEAIGDVKDRVILNEVNRIINESFAEIKINKQSKYERGVVKTLDVYKGIQKNKKSTNTDKQSKEYGE